MRKWIAVLAAAALAAGSAVPAAAAVVIKTNGNELQSVADGTGADQ